LTSVSIHIIPLVTTWNLKWNTIPFEQTLPESERYFVSLSNDNGFDSVFFKKIFFIPLIGYLGWVALYYMKVFVISSKRIQEKNYETMFVYYIRKPAIHKLLSTFGMRLAPIVFMCFHIFFFIASSIFAMIAYHNVYIHTLLMLMWILLSIWNGANFYMEYFSRKYETNLKRLETIEIQLTTGTE